MNKQEPLSKGKGYTVCSTLEELQQLTRFTPVNNKKPYIKQWQNNPNSISFCENEIKLGNANGYGLSTGFGLLAIDFDGANADKIALAIGKWLTEIDTLAWSSGKPSRKQILVSIPENRLRDFEKLSRKPLTSFGIVEAVENEQLEIRYNRCQSVLPPSAHPETNGYYWLQDTEIAQLDDYQCNCILSAIDTDIQSNTKQYQKLTNTQQLKLIESALDFIKSDNYHDWVLVGMALKDSGYDLTLWDKWSSNSTKYKIGECEQKWRNFNGSGTSLGTLFWLAKQHGFDQKQWYRNNLICTKQNLNTTYEKSSNENNENNIIQLTQQLIEKLSKPDISPESRDLSLAIFGNQHRVSERAIRLAIESKLEADYKQVEIESLSGYLDNLVDVPKRNLDLEYIFGDYIGIVIKEQAKKLPTNPSALALCLFAVVASLIGTSSKTIVNLNNRHSVPFILRLCLVAESGKGKTPTIKVATESLNNLYKSIYRQYKRELQDWEQLPKEEQSKQPKPIFKKIIVKDVTFEGLFKALQHNNGSCLLLRDELIGYYNGLTNYGKSKGDATQRDLELFQGDSINITRSDSDREVFIERSAVSFLGGMQPVMVSELLNQKTDEAGTSVRLTFFCGDFPDHVLMSRESYAGNDFLDFTNILVDTLSHKTDYSDLFIDDEAYFVLMNWYNNEIVPRRQLQVLDKEKSKHSKVLDEAVKYASFLHYIFMIFNPDMITNNIVINKETMERGIYIANFSLAHYLYLTVYCQDDALPAHFVKILKLLEAKEEITANDAYQNHKSTWKRLNMKVNEVGELLLQLVDIGKAIKVPTKMGVRIKVKK
jgi:hypothetical protein